MPTRSELPSKVNRDKLAKALTRLGFIISKKGGKGSHIKATFIKTQKSITLPSNLHKHTLCYVIKEIEKYSDIIWDDIKKEL